MSMRYLPQCLVAIAILPLTGRLLQDFVRNHESCRATVDVKPCVIDRRPLAFQECRRTIAASAIRVVLLNGRIEETIGARGIAAEADGRAAASVPQRSKARAIVEAAVLI